MLIAVWTVVTAAVARQRPTAYNFNQLRTGNVLQFCGNMTLYAMFQLQIHARNARRAPSSSLCEALLDAQSPDRLIKCVCALMTFALTRHIRASLSRPVGTLGTCKHWKSPLLVQSLLAVGIVQWICANAIKMSMRHGTDKLQHRDALSTYLTCIPRRTRACLVQFTADQ